MRSGARASWLGGALALAAAALAAASVAACAGGGAPPRWLTIAAPATLSALVAAAWWSVRRRAAALAAVEQALFSLAERDYSVRLAIAGDAALAAVAARFNMLGEQLRMAESERYQRELLLETVLEATPSAVLLFDATDAVVFANAAARALFAGGDALDGLTLADVTARAPGELGASLAGFSEGLVTVEGGEGFDTYHVAQRRLELRYQPHRLVLVEPLTRELVRKEADAWKRAIRVICHELNNSLAPIASLVNTARKIVDRPEHAARLVEAFDTITDRTQHLQRFLDGYARFARLPKPVRQPLQWAPLLEQVRALYDFTMPAEVPPEPSLLDAAQVQQVLVNLVKNAIECGCAAAEIRVTVARADGATVLEVRDSGAGMSDDVLKQVLVPFYSTKKSGTGLGLPLCREIVEGHGGHLAVESQPAGGTVVRCVLPDA